MQENTATAFMIHGYLGAGKTTLARRLEVEHAAIRFTHDYWMGTLYGDDPPDRTLVASLLFCPGWPTLLLQQSRPLSGVHRS
jgi:hypothetical protein